LGGKDVDEKLAIRIIRTAPGEQLEESLKRLGVDHIDLV
jgi:aryl-alcohol dehydrogenase-like predicted oxidoreductase